MNVSTNAGNTALSRRALLAGAAALATVPVFSAAHASVARAAAASEEAVAPKYVFMFIGDGMSYPQIQATADYLGVQNDENYLMAQPSIDDNEGAILAGPSYLNFMASPALAPW